MLLDSKPLDALGDADLQALVNDPNAAELKRVEYKSQLPGAAASERLEFLADVSSFANASGGHLLYGIPTSNGIPSSVPGLDIAPQVDQTILSLDSMIRDGIRPRIAFTIHPIALHNGRVVLIIRIPRGYLPPHQVVFSQDYRFYSRKSNGKYRLDVDELRTVFDLSGTTADRIRQFRADRVLKIIEGETPAPLNDAPKVVLHLVPLTAFDPAAHVDVRQLAQGDMLDQIRPTTIAGVGIHHRFNFDGLLRFERADGSATADAYVQVFHNGSIEAADAYLVQKPIPGLRGSPHIRSERYEQALIDALSRYLQAQATLGAAPPIIVMVSLVGVAGYYVSAQSVSGQRDAPYPIDRDTLLMPELQLDSLQVNPAVVLRPAFDAVANAGGWPQSPNYDERGQWIGRQTEGPTRP